MGAELEKTLGEVRDGISDLSDEMRHRNERKTAGGSIATFTPAAASHTAGDVNDTFKEFTDVGPVGSRIMITSTSLVVESTGVISGEPSYRLHLYNVTPPSALGDNAPWDLPAGDRASYLGFVDLGTPVDVGSTLYVETNIVNKQLSLHGQGLFAYLVTIGPYTPTASRVYKVTLQSVAL